MISSLQCSSKQGLSWFSTVLRVDKWSGDSCSDITCQHTALLAHRSFIMICIYLQFQCGSLYYSLFLSFDKMSYIRNSVRYEANVFLYRYPHLSMYFQSLPCRFFLLPLTFSLVVAVSLLRRSFLVPTAFLLSFFFFDVRCRSVVAPLYFPCHPFVVHLSLLFQSLVMHIYLASLCPVPVSFLCHIIPFPFPCFFLIMSFRRSSFAVPSDFSFVDVVCSSFLSSSSSFLCRSVVLPFVKSFSRPFVEFLCRSFVVPLSFLCRGQLGCRSFVVPRLPFLRRSFPVASCRSSLSSFCRAQGRRSFVVHIAVSLCRHSVVPLSSRCRSSVVPLSSRRRSSVVTLSFLCRAQVVTLSCVGRRSFLAYSSFLCVLPSVVLRLFAIRKYAAALYELQR